MLKREPQTSQEVSPCCPRIVLSTATALLSGVTVALVDEDLSKNDPICGPNVVPVQEGNFLLGRWTLACDEGEFRVMLSPQ
ncbi:MAG: hypothetical protein JNJ46_10940 [Myxococcales bacterium]|nr:hypothetical protein [Myxococcales bacterium]